MDNFDWDHLLTCIEERVVVPVIGREVFTVERNGKPMLLDEAIARSLVQKSGLDPATLPDRYGVHRAASELLSRRTSDGQKLYRMVCEAADEMKADPPSEAVRKLAEITGFSLYLCTHSGGVLSSALDHARKPKEKTTELAFALNHRRDDLSQDLLWSLEDGSSRSPVVYQLFGRLNGLHDFVATEEDALEFMHEMPTDRLQPKRLFQKCKSSHLLFIGCSYPDWLTRFLIRTIGNSRLAGRPKTQWVADDRTSGDEDLGTFLKQQGVQVYGASGTQKFVDALHERWLARRPAGSFRNFGDAVAPGSVFLSYASDDVDLVESVKRVLDAKGLDVWLDKRSLKPAEAWELAIQRGISRCAIFVPFISASTQRDGVFRDEWDQAVEMASQPARTASEYRFIWPVFLGGLDRKEARVPEAFRAVHWTDYHASLQEEFAEEIKGAVRKARLSDPRFNPERDPDRPGHE